MPKISVVIPVLNDAVPLRGCLDAIRSLDPCGLELEVIVVDGGECRQTRAVCDEVGVAYLQSAQGRGAQMNHGAGRATGDWLWFVHADCLVPACALVEMEKRIRGGQVLWGAFKHRVDHPSPVVRMIEWFDYVRSITAAMPYGDQGIFVAKNAFLSLGGYREDPILEDVMLCEALAGLARPAIIKAKIITSARRMQRLGIIKTTFINWRVMWMYYRGNRDFAAIRRFYNQ